MASASIMSYSRSPCQATFPRSYWDFPPYHEGAIATSPAPSPRHPAFPRYDGYANATGYPSPGALALAAAQVAGDNDSDNSSRRAARKANTGVKRRSWGRAESSQLDGAADDQRPSPTRPTTKEKLKTNMKKVSQQKRDPATTLDLSLTAEENERRTGLPLVTARAAPRSATDVAFVRIAKRGMETADDYTTPATAFQPSRSFTLPTRPASRPQTPHSAYHSQANSAVASDLSMDHFDIARQSSGQTSGRPSLRINTSSDVESVSTLAQKRRNTNQSSASATPPTSKPRRSFDRAFSIVTRRDSHATEDAMDPVTREASIRAARQAFEKREQKKDAKYEKRAEKERERQEQKQLRRTSERSRAGSTAPKNSSNLHLSEKAEDDVVVGAYDDLPVPMPSNRQPAGPGLLPSIPKVSRKRRAKNRYAAFLSWLKTKLLNITRRRKAAKKQ